MKLLIIGVILALAGIISTIFGIVQNGDVEAQAEALLTGGSANPGTIWIILGAIALIAGIVLVIVHFKKVKKD